MIDPTLPCEFRRFGDELQLFFPDGNSLKLSPKEWASDSFGISEKERKMSKGLNIIDALKSGKPFRRIGTKHWLLFDSAVNTWSFDRITLLATDWEIEERKVEITESQFDTIYHEVLSLKGRHEFSYELKKRLFEK